MTFCRHGTPTSLGCPSCPSTARVVDFAAVARPLVPTVGGETPEVSRLRMVVYHLAEAARWARGDMAVQLGALVEAATGELSRMGQ